MIEIRFVIRDHRIATGERSDAEVLTVRGETVPVPNVGDTVDIGATIYGVASRHFLYTDDKSGRVFVTVWLADLDGMVGSLLRASR